LLIPQSGNQEALWQVFDKSWKNDVESGKLVGAVLPMSEKAQIQMRNSIEVIDYLLNQERVVWS
jgi:hypothetical protein